MWYGDSIYSLCNACKVGFVALSDDPSFWRRVPSNGTITWVALKSCPACRSKQAENRARNRAARSVTPASSTSSALTTSSFNSVIPLAHRAPSSSPVRGLPIGRSPSPPAAGGPPSRAPSIARSPSRAPSIARSPSPQVIACCMLRSACCNN